MNPNALVPTIEDELDVADGHRAGEAGEGCFRLWESNVVRALSLRPSRALAASTPSRCSPASTPSAGWTGNRRPSTRPAATPSSNGCARRPSSATTRRQRARCRRWSRCWARLEARLATRAHLCGDALHDGRHPDRLRAAPLVRAAGFALHAARVAASRALLRWLRGRPRRVACSTGAGMRSARRLGAFGVLRNREAGGKRAFDEVARHGEFLRGGRCGPKLDRAVTTGNERRSLQGRRGGRLRGAWSSLRSRPS